MTVVSPFHAAEFDNWIWASDSHSMLMSQDQRKIAFWLSEETLDNIKLNDEVCTEDANCAIIHGVPFVDDMAGVATRARPIEDALWATPGDLATDVLPPALVGLEVNMSSLELALMFDEPVRTSTADADGNVELVGTDNVVWELHGGNISTGNGISITLTLLKDDADNVKLLSPDLFASLDTSSMKVKSLFIEDMAGNSVNASTEPVDATEFERDSIPPILLSFAVYLDAQELVFRFDEPVNGTTLTLKNTVTLLAAPNTGANGTYGATENASTWTERYELTGGQGDGTNGLRQDGEFSVFDLDRLMFNPNLLTSTDTSYMAITSGLVTDMAGNPVVAVPDTEAMRSSEFYNDTTKPTVASCTLNMNVVPAMLAVNFTEVVDQSTLQIGGITLQRGFDVNRTDSSLNSGRWVTLDGEQKN